MHKTRLTDFRRQEEDEEETNLTNVYLQTVYMNDKLNLNAAGKWTAGACKYVMTS